MSRRRKSERGVSLAVVAITMTAFLAISVVAIDIGHIGLSANEVQIVADSAARAAGRSLLVNKMNGTSQNAVSAGETVGEENPVDGNSPDQPTVTLGTYDIPAWRAGTCVKEACFTEGGSDPNAARAVSTASVANLLAGMFGYDTSDVERNAIAAYGSTCGGETPLPLAIGECHFTAYQSSQNCSALPHLQQVPNGVENSCWTSLSNSDPSSTNTLIKYLPPQCCQGGICGGGDSAPPVSEGDPINLSDGQNTAVLKVIKDCFDKGIREWLVPVVNCNQCNGSQPGIVQGFAKVVIQDVVVQGNNKGITLQSLCRSDPGGGSIGCENFGVSAVALMK